MLICVLLFGTGGLGEAAKMVSPPEGAVYEAGQSFVVRVEPGAGEKLISMLVGFDEVKPDSRGILEYTIHLPVGVKLGTRKRDAGVVLYDQNGKYQEIVLSHTITVILPPTTVVKSIGARFALGKKTFPSIARKPSGELVTLGADSDRELTVGATYSDGVGRNITDNPDLTYKSLNEKVAVVFPSGQGKDSYGKIVTGYALVRATGHGRTDIIVQYGEHTDRVTVQVDECPYIEGKMNLGCPLR